jgi:hypothetical protein
MPSNETAGQPSLDARLFGAVGEDAYIRYAMAKRRHYYLWKYHRISDGATLARMRTMLYEAGLLTPLTEGGWVIDRGAAEYEAGLGVSLRGFADQKGEKERLSGRHDPSKPFVWMDSGPGNGTALYEGAAPGKQGAGWGIELLYSVEGTLRKVMHPVIRSRPEGSIAAYEYSPFAALLNQMEVLSVVELVTLLAGAGDTAFLDRIIAILDQAPADGEILASAVLHAHAVANSDEHPRHQGDGEVSFTAVALSFLIDELVCRTRIPNGMNFWYEEASLVCHALAEALPDLAGYLGHPERENLQRVLPILAAEAERLNASDTEQTPDAEWMANTRRVADIIRSAAYEGRRRRFRKLPDGPATLMFTAANTLWRWSFFLEHRAGLRDGLAANDNARIELVMQWLRRPWGIVRQDDIDTALRGFLPDDDGPAPKLLHVLQEIFPSEPDVYVTEVLRASSRETGLAALRTLVARRVVLDNLRTRVLTVRIDRDDLLERAQCVHTIIDLMATWWYARVAAGDAPDFAHDIARLATLMREGRWIDQAIAELEHDLALGAEQREDIREYRSDPAAFTEQWFTFSDDDFDIRASLDVFPPEQFWFMS